MTMRWILKEKGQLEDLPGPEDVPRLIRRLLHSRGLHGASEVRRFFEPSLEGRHDPWLLPDLDRAVERLDQAITRNESVFLFGDYDVDGISALALLSRYLTFLGARVRARVPNRLTDDYGLSIRAVDEARAWGSHLIVTVDSGTTAHAEIRYARQLGIDVVVADHHQPEPDLPPALALVNPWRADSRYPFPDLAAAGVVTKILEGLWEVRRRRDGSLRSPHELLDLTALGTIADSVSMRDENRLYVHHGLGLLRGGPRAPLRALLDASRIDAGQVTSGDLAFQVIPRLNAAGRLGNADLSLKLLLSEDLEGCRGLAAVLEEHNERRKALLDEVVREATVGAEGEEGIVRGEPLILKSEGWHPGVLGIAAARLAERFNVPTILLGSEGSILRGSGRTARRCDLLELIREASGSLRSFGGHRAAVGLTLEDREFPRFREQVVEAARRRPEIIGFRERELRIDAGARLDEVDFELSDWLDRMEPYGPGNQEPVFAFRAHVVGSIRVLKGKHVRFDLTDGVARVECIGFHLAERIRELDLQKGQVHVAATVMRNSYRGEERLQLSMRDIAVESPFGIR